MSMFRGTPSMDESDFKRSASEAPSTYSTTSAKSKSPPKWDVNKYIDSNDPLAQRLVDDPIDLLKPNYQALIHGSTDNWAYLCYQVRFYRALETDQQRIESRRVIDPDDADDFFVIWLPKPHVVQAIEICMKKPDEVVLHNKPTNQCDSCKATTGDIRKNGRQRQPRNFQTAKTTPADKTKKSAAEKRADLAERAKKLQLKIGEKGTKPSGSTSRPDQEPSTSRKASSPGKDDWGNMVNPPVQREIPVLPCLTLKNEDDDDDEEDDCSACARCIAKQVKGGCSFANARIVGVDEGKFNIRLMERLISSSWAEISGLRNAIPQNQLSTTYSSFNTAYEKFEKMISHLKVDVTIEHPFNEFVMQRVHRQSEHAFDPSPGYQYPL